MSGPEHYREGEQILAGILEGRYDESERPGSELLAVAQVHATLALAGATALGASGTETEAWAGVAGQQA